MNLTEPIRRVARDRPADPAVVDGEVVYSYRDLWSSISRMARLLADRGLRPGDRVLLWLPNGAGFLAAHFGAMATGLLSIPLKAENGPAELAFALADSRPRLLVAHRDLLTRLPGGPPPDLDCLMPDEVLPGGEVLDVTSEDVPDDHPASVVYSYVFGEGRPYGAVLTHANHYWIGVFCAPFFRVDPGDRLLILLPMPHVFPMGMGILPAFYVGGTIYCGDALRPRTLLETITRERITHIPCVPQVFEQLARSHRPDRYDLRSIKNLTSGADFLPEEIHRSLQGVLGVTIIQGYGMTETFPSVCNPPDAGNRPGTLGIAVHPRIRYRILDPQDRELPPGEVGEIEMQTPCAMAGYLDAPEATARLLHDGWVRSGDLGWIDSEGYLRYQSLKKPIINIAGNKVDPLEVARIIEQCEGVAAARVAALVTPGNDSLASVSLKAEVELEPGAKLEERAIRAHCRSWLAAYKVPQKVELRPHG
jgi:acyl-CoA synthetase (AMP-forming)/AMP-acid ligase II